jgi:hypothetical protein
MAANVRPFWRCSITIVFFEEDRGVFCSIATMMNGMWRRICLLVALSLFGGEGEV